MSVRQKDLVDEYIECVSGRGPAGARLRGYGVDVWALVMYFKEVAKGDPEVLARDYQIPREAVNAALAFYRQHRRIIDARIVDNQHFFS
jgi:uncharacterized protein (DUF433 family)